MAAPRAVREASAAVSAVENFVLAFLDDLETRCSMSTRAAVLYPVAAAAASPST